MITEIFRNIWKPIRYNVKNGDNVVILTDPTVDSNIIDSLVSAVWASEAVPTLLVIPTPKFHEELSSSAASAVIEADLLIAAASRPVSRTRAVQSARDKGVRYLAMGGVTVETLLTGSITADPEELYQLTAKFAGVLDQGEAVRITSEAGMDLTFSIKGRKALALDGRMDEIGRSAGIPTGEAALAPVEGTAEGVAVIDGAVHEIGLLSEPIVMKVEKGNVTKITGGAEASRLRELLETSGDANSYNIGEFAFGTNPASSVTHNVQEFKNKLGTIHIALGNNKNLFGDTFSKTHLDAIVLKPTVSIDGKTVIEQGTPVI